MLEIEDEIPTWKEAMDQGKLENVSSYIQFCEFVEKMNVTNDCAERNIGLIQRYIDSSRKEENWQDILLFVQEHCKDIDVHATQQELFNL